VEEAKIPRPTSPRSGKVGWKYTPTDTITIDGAVQRSRQAERMQHCQATARNQVCVQTFLNV